MLKDTKKRQKEIAKRKLTLRKKYAKPALKKLGDLRAITLGGTTVGPDFSFDNRGPFNP